MAAKETEKQSEDRFTYERELLSKGIQRIAGVDEAGRGPLAGPVVAAAVIFPVDWIEAGLTEEWQRLNDSKKLSERQRETFFNLITTTPEINYAISEVSAEVIDEINILQATHLAMNQSLDKLKPSPQHALVDGLRVKSMEYPQTPIVKGDSKSFSIAAASVLAKVTRDRLMLYYHEQFSEYGFADHKGYGTKKHREAIEKFGPCPIHRRTFAPIRQMQPELFDRNQ